MPDFQFEYVFTNNKEHTSYLTGCDLADIKEEEIRRSYRKITDEVAERFLREINENGVIDSRKSEFTLYGNGSVCKEKGVALGDIYLTVIIPLTVFENDTLVETIPIDSYTLSGQLDLLFSKIRRESTMKLGDASNLFNYDYILFQNDILKHLLLVIEQYITDQKIIMKKQGGDRHKIVVEKENNINNETCRRDLLNSSVADQSTISKIVEICAKKENVIGDEALFLEAKEFINYSTMLDFETGNLKCIVRADGPNSHEYYKLCIEMNIEEVIEDFYSFENDHKSLLIKLDGVI